MQLIFIDASGLCRESFFKLKALLSFYKLIFIKRKFVYTLQFWLFLIFIYLKLLDCVCLFFYRLKRFLKKVLILETSQHPRKFKSCMRRIFQSVSNYPIVCTFTATSYQQIYYFFVHLGFLSRSFTNHRSAGEGGGHFFNSLVPLPPASN